MKFSYQWIRELVPGLHTPARELERLITVHTAECDGIHPIAQLLKGARHAVLVSVDPIPDVKSVRATVDIGGPARLTVVCGAPNCRVGLRTIWVPAGLKVLHGIESEGMLASPAELGIGRFAEGIIELDAAGLDLQPDDVIEIDNKSLTHRPDLWGHLGMAREVAAISKQRLHDPVDLGLLPAGSDSFDVRIDDYGLCPRFSAIAFENVRVGPSPWWLQYRLISAGLNPINNIVDITNYVMAELAQPMHAFDRDRLRGDRLIVRRAHEGEELAALNQETYKLTPATCVVADAAGAVSVAGIIGGMESAIGSNSTRVVFESANWNASNIRKTSSALKLRTDASMRFEKAQDPVNTVRALARAIALMSQICPEARLAGRLTDDYRTLPNATSIRLNLDVLDRKLGVSVPPRDVEEILTRLDFAVSPEAERIWRVGVPSWRATKDVSVADDLVEEVGRMIGYDTIAPTAPAAACTVPPDNPNRTWHRQIRSLLTARGYTEVYNYSFLSDAQADRFQLPATDLVRVINPIASDQNLLRSSLIPGIFANLELNAKHYPAFRLFEIGREIHNRGAELPREVTHLVAAVYLSDSTGLFELKGVAESLAPGSHVTQTEDTLAFEHPARTANVYLGEHLIGRLFEAYPSLIGSGRAAVLDLNLDRVGELNSATRAYMPIRRFPSSAFDLSFAVPLREPNGNVQAQIREFAGGLLESVAYLSEYVGPQVPAGMKNISYRLTVGAPDRTLSAEEIGFVRARVIAGMHDRGFEMRT